MRWLIGRRDIAFALVLVWALYGIWSKRQSGGSADDLEVATAALAAMIVLGAGVVGALVWRR